jgi:hypothetical protein
MLAQHKREAQKQILKKGAVTTNILRGSLIFHGCD